ncbi:OmpA family protein [Neogemmobacter tilapiae]|nr:OmpA family protein [Gemmobacter tilapiae]
MQKHLNYLLIGASVLGLSACQTSFTQEAGMQVDKGQFGNSTMNNVLLQSGEITYMQALGGRFAAEVPSTITFEFNSAVLSPAAMAALNQQANWIRQFPELRFSVYGHTDLVGSNAYNYALGKKRAEVVVSYLETKGISRSRLKALVSYGETRPVIATPNPETQNRRTVTEVSGFVENHPMVLNGKYAQVIMREYLVLAERLHPENTDVQTQVDPSQ